MDAAKSKVKSFLSSSGQHSTTHHESVAPAVTKENISQTQHENVTAAVDREVHQDHFHTTVQPVHHQETLAEQHHQNAIPVEHRSFDHTDSKDREGDIKRHLDEERAQFKDESVRHEGAHTQAVQSDVIGEHRHHHVHENIQPVVQKQTVEPHVVHTTVPIHEVHHNKVQHHATSNLEPVSMDDFKKGGGALTGRGERTFETKGEPGSDIGSAIPGHPGRRDGESGFDSSRTTGGASSTPIADAHSTGGNTGSFGHMEETQKPSLMDRINPKTDSNADGTAGFMK